MPTETLITHQQFHDNMVHGVISSVEPVEVGGEWALHMTVEHEDAPRILVRFPLIAGRLVLIDAIPQESPVEAGVEDAPQETPDESLLQRAIRESAARPKDLQRDFDIFRVGAEVAEHAGACSAAHVTLRARGEHDHPSALCVCGWRTS